MDGKTFIYFKQSLDYLGSALLLARPSRFGGRSKTVLSTPEKPALKRAVLNSACTETVVLSVVSMVLGLLHGMQPTATSTSVKF